MERVDRIAGLVSVIIDLLDKLAEPLHLGDDSILVLHDRQLTVKQTDKLSAKLIALIFYLELLFIVGNVVEYRLDLSCLLLDLLIEIFTLCLLLSKLTFDLSHFSIERFYLILMLAVLLDRVAVTSGLLRFADINTVFSTNIAENSPLL